MLLKFILAANNPEVIMKAFLGWFPVRVSIEIILNKEFHLTGRQQGRFS